MKWYGVMPAMTTCLDENLNVDHAFMAKHAQWMLDSGCTGIISLGSLGEAATLTFDEKIAILKNMVATVNGRAPVVAAISALSTAEAVALAKAAAEIGCSGLMVLPPYLYRGDWRETKSHMAAIFKATPLPCMLYNNPIAYGTDFTPQQIHELAAEHTNLNAVKESSTDVRRIAAIRAIEDGKINILVGVDDGIVESIAIGATGWVAGLVNAFPVESVALFDYAIQGHTKEAFELYRWFLPLLRMDTVPKFIQLIKLVQQEVGQGNARVRPPRLEIVGAEFDEAIKTIREAVKTRPHLLVKA
jgi:4-hydroxy-tetrahydrodipicolinate synthase